jgi:hypothetical protein
MLAAKCLTFGQTDSSLMAKPLLPLNGPDHSAPLLCLAAIAPGTIGGRHAIEYRITIDLALKKR